MPVEIDNVIHQVYVLKRPYVDEFLVKVGELFECVLFTASLAKVSVRVHRRVRSKREIEREQEIALLIRVSICGVPQSKQSKLFLVNRSK